MIERKAYRHPRSAATRKWLAARQVLAEKWRSASVVLLPWLLFSLIVVLALCALSATMGFLFSRITTALVPLAVAGDEA